MATISDTRDELVTLIDEVETASAMRTGAVFDFIPYFITSARAGVERIDEGLASVVAEDGTSEDFDRREALNHINDFVEAFRNVYKGSTSEELPSWIQWSHDSKLVDFYQNFFTQVDAMAEEQKTSILELVYISLDDARETYEKWKSQVESEGNSELVYHRSLAYTLRDLCIEALDLLGYTGKQIAEVRMNVVGNEATATTT